MSRFACSLLFLAAGLVAAAQPNVIFFLADDQRHDVLGCYGHPFAKTPTIDSLAERGVRFANSFVQVPICASSRCTIFTGVSQRTHGYNFGEPAVPAHLTAASYPKLLRDAGYRTGFFGKYGVNMKNGGGKQLFDVFQGINRSPYLKKQKDGSTRHETELCGDGAVAFLDDQPADKPFCLSVSFNATHAEDGDKRPGYHFQWPAIADGMYDDVTIPPPALADDKYFKATPDFMQNPKELSRQRFFWRWDTPEKYQTNMRAYFRMLSGIDMTIARVLKKLEEKGLADNTIIIYTADNGFMYGDRGLAGKWHHYEQSLRVPLVIYDPRVPEAKRGRVVDDLVSNLDVAPTLLAAAGLPIPAHYQGLPLTDFIAGNQPDTWREDVFCQHFFRRYPDWHAVRGKRYKYAVYYNEKGGPLELLYDLQKDPTEFTNLAGNPEYASVLKQYRERTEHYRATFPKQKK